MSKIDLDIVCHHLTTKLGFKPITQMKLKEGEDKMSIIFEQVKKLKEEGFIQEISYPTWLANIVMVKKTSGKLRMCLNFNGLN